MPSKESKDTSSLRNVLLASYGEWKHLDMERMAPYYSKDPGVVIFNDVEPANLVGWERFKEEESKIMARTSEWNLEPKDVKVTVWGPVGLTTAVPVLRGKSKKGSGYESPIRHTAVWEKKGDHWQIVHEHWSFPLRPLAPT